MCGRPRKGECHCARRRARRAAPHSAGPSRRAVGRPRRGEPLLAASDQSFLEVGPEARQLVASAGQDQQERQGTREAQDQREELGHLEHRDAGRILDQRLAQHGGLAAAVAAERGAQAVVGIDLDYETVGQGGSMLMVTASGTAVKLG